MIIFINQITVVSRNVIFINGLCIWLNQIIDRGNKRQKISREKLFETNLVASCFQGSFLLYVHSVFEKSKGPMRRHKFLIFV